MRVPAVLCAALGAVIAMTASRPAIGQVSVGGIALNQLEPAPAGDPFFGVPSPSIGGHLEPRAALLFDYSHKPLRFVLGPTETAVVASQAFLHLDVSLALWDRILIDLHAPFAVAQSGQDPMLPGVSFNPPSSAAFGDLRLGLRGRLVGEDASPFQASLGAYFFAPTSPSNSYVGDDALRGAPHAIFGGKIGTGTAFVWSASAGVMLRASENPDSFTFGGGAAVLLLDEALSLGAETYGSVALGESTLLQGTGLTVAAGTNTEVLGSVRVRFLRGLVIGAAAGPGVAAGLGTPTFRVAALLGWMPPGSESSEDPAESAKGDRDDDGFRDDVDACPDEKGELQGDPAKDGCPPPDRDYDSILDIEDACPSEAGAKNTDATKNGCPEDSDGDAISDTKDACPRVRGSASSDPRLNGCPQDGDGDGVLDDTDACPGERGAKSADPKRNGCPLDSDGDAVADAVDACPNQRGVKSSDARRNGCPAPSAGPKAATGGGGVATAPDAGSGLNARIEFNLYGRYRTQTVEPVTDELLRGIRDAIMSDPTIDIVEVQGHTDDSGDPQFNASLALGRAEEVRSWLIAVGVPANKLVAKGYGDQVPVGDNRIFDGRQMNRRVDFKVIKK